MSGEPAASFDDWWSELERAAAARGVPFLLSPDPEDHKRGWREGYTPHEELDELVYAASV